MCGKEYFINIMRQVSIVDNVEWSSMATGSTHWHMSAYTLATYGLEILINISMNRADHHL